MFCLFFSNAKVKFTKKKPIQKTYITKKVLLMIHQVKFIDKNKFAEERLD